MNEALPGVFLAIYGIEESLKEIDRRFDQLSSEIGDIEQGLYAGLSRDLAEMRRARGGIGATIDRRAELQQLYRNLE